MRSDRLTGWVLLHCIALYWRGLAVAYEGQHGLKSQGSMVPSFPMSSGQAQTFSTYLKAGCLFYLPRYPGRYSWSKDRTGCDLLAGGRRVDGWEGSPRQTRPRHLDKSGRASLLASLTRLLNSLRNSQVQLHGIHWPTPSHRLLLVPLRAASTNAQSSFSTHHTSTTPQPSFLLFSN